MRTISEGDTDGLSIQQQQTTGRGGMGNIKHASANTTHVHFEPTSPTAITGREVSAVRSSVTASVCLVNAQSLQSIATHVRIASCLQGNSNAGRGGSGNISHTLNVSSPLPSRTAMIMAQHSARTAEYERELIKRSAEARRQRHAVSWSCQASCPPKRGAWTNIARVLNKSTPCLDIFGSGRSR
jgi:hypothetical protein